MNFSSLCNRSLLFVRHLLKGSNHWILKPSPIPKSSLFFSLFWVFLHLCAAFLPSLLPSLWPHSIMDFLDNYLIQPAISAVFNLVIEQIISDPVQRFLGRSKTTRDLLGHLKQTVLALNAVVADAEQKTITNEPVKLWLDELKDAMYDVEALLDEIATQALQSTIEEPDAVPESSSIKKVISSISTFLHQPVYETVDSNISDMCTKLDGFLQQISILGLQVRHTGKHFSRAKKPTTTSLLDQSMQYVGRDSEIEAAIRFLQYEQQIRAEQNQKRKKIESHNSDIRIIAIVGMPGVGKTTLAQLLYNDRRLNDMFDLKAWLHLPREFTNTLVFKTIYELLCQKPLRSENLELIQLKLCKMISGKRLLLVFDDVWIEHFRSWDELIRPVKTASSGSTIIVTTQNVNVATWMHANYKICLNPLSDEECWSIIRSVALDNLLYSLGNLEVIGRQIALKCQGLPLAAVVLGGALRSTAEEAEKWEVLLRSPIWEIPDAVYGILPALRLSYDYLPHPQIKRCFAFCSLFPKNYRFQKEELVLLWMAEGFIAPAQSHTTMEQLGRNYFDELISRSFFQQSNSSTRSFVMHDLIHDLAVRVFGRFGLLWNSSDQFNLGRARHFSFLQTKYHDSEKFQVLCDHSLWTFLALGSGVGGSPCYIRTIAPTSEPLTCTSLRVLSMPHYQVTRITPSIGNFKHLRYLNFSSTAITSLPDTISSLYNLQTLLLSNCYNLQSLPAKLHNVISLRHLDVNNTQMLQEMPPHISRLTNLQTLSKFVVGSDSRGSIAELNQLNSLRGILLISRIENVVSESDVVASKMREKTHLEEIVYEWSGSSRNQYWILDKLNPHINLKRLTIKGFFYERFPGWLGAAEYCNLVVLHLKDCFKCISLPPLGQLPSLKHLSIMEFTMIREVGPDFYGNNSSSSFTPFPSLEILKFGNMPLWYSWSAFEGDRPAFHLLQELCLLCCKNLHPILPLNIPSLRRLAIVDCETGGSLRLPSSLDTLELSPWHGMHKALSALLELAPLRTLKIGRSYMKFSTKDATKEPILINPSYQELEISKCTFKPVGRIFPWLSSLSMDGGVSLEGEEYCYASLQYLCLSKASSIQSFCFDHFPKLITLEISKCIKLRSLLVPEGYLLESLCDLSIHDCYSLMEFPPGGLPAPNLTSLTINGCHRLKSLPERMYCSMTSLQFLSIKYCPEIGSFPLGGLPSNLHTLKINGCYKLMPVQEDWQLPQVSSLVNLEIGESGNQDTSEFFPSSEGVLPTNVTSLSIRDLKSIKFLNGKAFRCLTSLQELKISKCPLLECLPAHGFPRSLCSLEIYACPLLQLQCQEESGKDWPKISHLPHFRIHHEEI